MVTLVLAATQPHKIAGGPAFDLAVAVLACLPIILLRRWPLPLFAVAALVGGVETALGAASLPLAGVLGLAMYFVAVRLRWRTSACSVVAALVAFCGGLLYEALATERGLVGADALDSSRESRSSVGSAPAPRPESVTSHVSLSCPRVTGTSPR